jgi:hypothetical protein
MKVFKMTLKIDVFGLTGRRGKFVGKGYLHLVGPGIHGLQRTSHWTFPLKNGRNRLTKGHRATACGTSRLCGE